MIEQATENGEIKVIVATTTLAEGINLPFRFTILVDWLVYNGSPEEEPMSPILFRNIAGRCGRAGSYTEGDTIIYDNPISDSPFATPSKRQEVIRGLISPPESQLSSALALLETPLKDEQRSEIAAPLASQFLAAIAENREVENLGDEFTNALYLTSLLGRPGEFTGLRRTVSSIERDLLGGGELALARAASPLRPTEFGQRAIFTGLSPTSCRALVRRLRTADLEDLALPDLLATLLELLIDLPEVVGTIAPKVHKKGSRFLVKPKDVTEILRSWMRGEPVEQSFANLPYVKNSKKQPTVDVWVEGYESTSKRDDDFDHFMDFLSQVVQFQLPWISRGIAELEDYIDNPRVTLRPWTLIADYLEYGVDSPWAVSALEEGAPASRDAIARFGRLVVRSVGTSSDLRPLSNEEFQEWKLAIAQEFEATAGLKEEDYLEILAWLETQPIARP